MGNQEQRPPSLGERQAVAQETIAWALTRREEPPERAFTGRADRPAAYTHLMLLRALAPSLIASGASQVPAEWWRPLLDTEGAQLERCHCGEQHRFETAGELVPCASGRTFFWTGSRLYVLPPQYGPAECPDE